jgi:uncharacterized protein (DUF1499 family)
MGRLFEGSLRTRVGASEDVGVVLKRTEGVLRLRRVARAGQRSWVEVKRRRVEERIQERLRRGRPYEDA